jgi:TonB family protein
MRFILLALTVSLALTAGTQDPFLGAVPHGELTVKPVVKVKRIPYVERSIIKSASDTLQLEFVIERDGTVKAVRVAEATGEARAFERPAVEALKEWRFDEWRFDPGANSSGPTRALAVATVRFKLPPQEEPPALRPGFYRGPARELGSVTIDGVDDPFLAGAVRNGEPGVTLPVLVEKRTAKYPPGQVMKDRVQGNVHIEAVITTKGSIGNLRVVESVDQRLNGAALEAARHWKFKPALKDGKPVAFAIVIEMEFLLYTGLPSEAHSR